MDQAVVAMSIVLLAACFVDLRTRRIPNVLVAFGLCLGFGLSFSVMGNAGLRFALEGAGVALAIGAPLFLVRALGAGDVKLMMVVGTFVGPADAWKIALLAFVVSGVLALLDSLLQRRLGSLFASIRSTVFALAVRDVALASSLAQASARRMPFAIAILLGALAWLVYFY